MDDNFIKLYRNMIINNLPKNHITNEITLDYVKHGYSYDLSISLPKLDMRDEVKYIITSPSGNETNYKAMLSSGKYIATVDTNEIGIYKAKIEITNSKTAKYKAYEYYFTRDYSIEYNGFNEQDNIKLWEIVEDRGLLTANIDEIVNVEQADTSLIKHYQVPFIIAILVLFIIDVIIRKMNWTILFRKRVK